MRSIERLERVPPAWVVLVLLGLFAFQALHAIRLKGSTFDEGTHLAAGYSYLVTRDFRMNPEHPPLAKLLAASSLLLLDDVRFSADWPEWRNAGQWDLSERFLYRDNDANELLFWGRVPIVLLACLLGAFVYGWASELGGRAAAFCALLLYACTPDFLAHGALVTTDLAAAAFSFIAFRFQWLLLQRVTAARVALFGLALGAALSSKFNTLVFLPLFVAFPLLRAYYGSALPLQRPFRESDRLLETRGARIGVLLCAILTAGVVALAVIWASYGLRSSSTVAIPSESLALVRDLHLLPEDYLYGLSTALEAGSERASFLLGEYSETGFRAYFPITFLVKTPIPEIVLILAACALLPLQARRRNWSALAVAAPAVLYFAVALTANLNIGHRHLLPMYPFLIVLAGVAAAAALRRKWSATLVGGLYAWLLFGAWLASPDYLAYFNELAGGSRGGMRIVVDSNLDWGQDLPGLKRWMDSARVERIYLSYFGTAMPEFYGIDYEPLPSFIPLSRPITQNSEAPAPEYLAVSATNLQKVYLRDGRAPPQFLEVLDRLRTRGDPVAVIGGSIYVYRLNAAEPGVAHPVKLEARAADPEARIRTEVTPLAALFSIEGTLSVAHFAEQKALVATWISMVTPQFREGLTMGLNECGRLGAITWIVDLTRNPGVPSQADLVWIENDCKELCQRNDVRAVINIHGKSAVATMGARRWSKSANANGMSTYDCSSLGDALALAAEVASGKAG